ncbi:MAG TPA: BON domain-containing protein [Thermoanaerobaculia bacterium]
MRTTTMLFAIAVIWGGAVPLTAASSDPVDLTATFRSAGAAIERLEVYEIAGVVLIRGRAASQEDAEKVGAHARQLGYSRVANLIETVRHNDAAIERAAQHELGFHRALDGCEFKVDARQGVIRLAGRVRHELQKDVALQVLRGIDGVRAIEASFERY